MDIVDLIPELGQVVPKCPEPMLIRAYRRAAREFCAQSRWLRADATLGTLDNNTSADVARYVLDIADPLNEVVGVRDIKGFTVGEPTNWWPVKPRNAMFFPPASASQPTRYAYVPEGSIDFFPTPDKAYGMTIVCAIQPVIGAEEISDVLLTKWKQVIEAGALSYLHTVPKVPWADARKADNALRAFRAGINNAMADEQRGFNQGAVRVRPRRIV